jgi:hypothetical protein
MRSLLWGVALLISFNGAAQGQGVDSVWVESVVLHGWVDEQGRTLVSHRIWVDLAPGYSMQVVFGDAHHDLEITTTTRFWNDTTRTVVYADELDEAAMASGRAWRDSWLAMGSLGRDHWAVPRAFDPDGSIVDPSAWKRTERKMLPRSLRERDGAWAADSVPRTTDWKFRPGYLAAIPGSVIHTMDGAWAVLGGTPGPTDGGHVLIAQLCTSGELSFRFNIQVADAYRNAIKYVHANPIAGEVLAPWLRRSVRVPHSAQ